MPPAPTVAPAAPPRGYALVRTAFALTLIPAVLAVGLAAGLRPDWVPTLLLSLAFSVFLVVMCYRGDPWARWILIAFIGLDAVRTVLEALGEGGIPWWAAAIATALDGAVIALLQAPSARSFLTLQRSKRQRPAPQLSL